jgi:hypothetical protein
LRQWRLVPNSIDELEETLLSVKTRRRMLLDMNCCIYIYICIYFILACVQDIL